MDLLFQTNKDSGDCFLVRAKEKCSIANNNKNLEKVIKGPFLLERNKIQREH